MKEIVVIMYDKLIDTNQRLQKLRKITASHTLSFDEKVNNILTLGVNAFDLNVGILSHIENGEYHIVRSISLDNSFPSETKITLQDTFCEYVINSDGPISNSEVSKSDWKSKPSFEKFHVASFIGTTVYQSGKIFGTLTFFSQRQVNTKFNDDDLEFIQLMANWLGLELEMQIYEKNILQKNRLLSAIGRVHDHFIDNVSAKTLFDDLLTDLLEISGSKYGFIGEINYTNEGMPYLKSQAITNIAWNEETQKFYEDNAPSGLEFYNLDTLFGRVLRTGKTLISNSPSEDKYAGGIPDGHPSLNAFSGIPIYHGGEFIGMVGIANRIGGYDEELLQFIDPLIKSCSNVLYAYRGDEKRKAVERAFNESEKRFHATFRSVPFGAALMNLDGSLILSNDALHQIISDEEDELARINYLSLLDEYSSYNHKDIFSEIAAGKRNHFNLECQFRSRAKEVNWASLTISLIRDEDENPFQILMFLEDITSRKEIELNLKQFKQTLDHTLDCVFMFEPGALHFFYANQGAIDQVGYSIDELLQMTPVDIKPEIDEKNFRALIAPLLIGDKESLKFETVHQHKDGTKIPVEIFLQFISIDNEMPRFVAIVRDISDRRKIDHMKNEFISTVSHELRTPLTSIVGSLSLVENGVTGDVNEDSLNLIGIAHRNANQLIAIINDILDMDKIMSGKMKFLFKDMDLSELLEKSFENNVGYAEQHKVKLVYDNKNTDAILRVDPDRFYQIMANLISNACKFSPENDVVSIYADIENNKARISIHDNGPGIPVAFREKIFAKFTQVDSSASRKKGGTGLGLSISKAFVEKMGGTIGFKSDANSGTTFTIVLPYE